MATTPNQPPPISKQVATDIALAYREIESAQALLDQITEAMSRHQAPDIRDAFGRRQDGLQLGVPSGNNGHRLFNVPWAVCKPVIELHIASQKAIISALTEQVGAAFKDERVALADRLEADSLTETTDA